MALFNAKALLDNKPHPVDIVLGHIEEGKETLLVILTLNMTDKLREVYREAEMEFHQSPRIPISSKKETVEGRVLDDPVSFCKAILTEGYADSQNIVDTPSKEAMLAVINCNPGFARKLANKLYVFFEGDEALKNMRDDEKN